jgi:magnesium transporter
MNVHVPGQGVPGYAWFTGIVAALVTLGVVGGFSTYKLMVR